MAYQQSTKDAINQAYQDTFGRPASFGTLGGADYWADEMENKGLTIEGLLEHLQASPEGQSVTTDAQGNKSSWIGGVNPNQSIADTWVADAAQTDPLKKSWASHFAPGGALAGDLTGTIWEGMAGAGTSTNPTTKNVAGILNATYNANNPNSTLPSPYYQNDPITATTPVPGGENNQTFGSGNTTGWWNQFADADAFKDFLKGDDTASDGMSDFMKFMMLMSVMGGGGFGGGYGGGGYQGSQYGYGGLTPGGVQAAYDPMKYLTGMGTWFKDNFGSGSGSSSSSDDSASSSSLNLSPSV